MTAARRRFRARVQLLVEGPQVDEESIDDFLDSVVADRGTEVKAKE